MQQIYFNCRSNTDDGDTSTFFPGLIEYVEIYLYISRTFGAIMEILFYPYVLRVA